MLASDVAVASLCLSEQRTATAASCNSAEPHDDATAIHPISREARTQVCLHLALELLGLVTV